MNSYAALIKENDTELHKDMLKRLDKAVRSEKTARAELREIAEEYNVFSNPYRQNALVYDDIVNRVEKYDRDMMSQIDAIYNVIHANKDPDKRVVIEYNEDEGYYNSRLAPIKAESVKLCTKCDIVKDVNDFYSTGRRNQRHKYCKICHNINRQNYKNKKLDPPKTGFLSLDKEIQRKIQYDIHVKRSFKYIASHYNIKYSTLLYWKKKGIRPYEP